ncbi:MAG TPA: hypothetical protein VNA89_12340 [Gemmatimonadaceae bacterium]|nr:hypothetical protein [Gemmatimonadaceae bacterium]
MSSHNEPPPDPAQVASSLRGQALAVAAADLGLTPTPEHAHVWGVLMETAYPEMVATLVALADGTTSLYLSGGGGIIGAGGHARVRAAAAAFLTAAEVHLGDFAPARGTPLPEPGRVRFYLRTFAGTLTAEADEQELGYRRHPLSPVFHAGHGVITAVRETSERRPDAAGADTSDPADGQGQAAMVLEVAEPPTHEERVVARGPDAATIEQIVEGLAWADITFVILKRDERNWIEGSGSLNPEDGLSARYMSDGDERVASRPPASLGEIIALLQSYRSGDERWREMMEWE